MTAVARKLNSIRESGGIRGREIAQLLETTPQTVSRWSSRSRLFGRVWTFQSAGWNGWLASWPKCMNRVTRVFGCSVPIAT